MGVESGLLWQWCGQIGSWKGSGYSGGIPSLILYLYTEVMAWNRFDHSSRSAVTKLENTAPHKIVPGMNGICQSKQDNSKGSCSQAPRGLHGEAPLGSANPACPMHIILLRHGLLQRLHISPNGMVKAWGRIRGGGRGGRSDPLAGVWSPLLKFLSVVVWHYKERLSDYKQIKSWLWQEIGPSLWWHLAYGTPY